MLRNKYKKLLVFGGIIFVLLFVFSPIQTAKADPTTTAVAALAIPGIGPLISALIVAGGVAKDAATSLPQQLVSYLLQVILQGVGYILNLLVNALNAIINIPVIPQNGVPVVTTLWKTLRDMANMLFIVVLVISAFATLFDIEAFGYKGYNFSSIIMRLIIAAVLINFSLVIGQLIINGTQVLNNVFLHAMGNISGRFINDINPAQWIPGLSGGAGGSAPQAADTAALPIIASLFAIIFLSSFAVSVLVAVAVAVARIPILWFLLIISPLAWIASTFPMFRKQFDNWWRQFIGWNLFLPLFLFFLYISLVLLSAQSNVASALIGSAANTPLLAGYPISIQLILFYVMVEMALVGGTGMAIKFSSSLAGGIGGVAGWAEKRAKTLPILGHIEALRPAVKMRLEEMGKRGEEGQKKQIDIMAARVFRSPEAQERLKEQQFKKQKDLVGKVDKETAHLKEQEQAGQLNINADFAAETWQTNRNSPEGIARRALLYERGMIDPINFGKDMAEWTKENPFLANSMLAKAQKGGFKNVKADQLLRMAKGEGEYESLKTSPGGAAIRKQLYMSLLGDKDIPGIDDALKKMTAADVGQAVSLMGGSKSNEATKFKKDLTKKRPDIVGRHNMDVDSAERATKGLKPVDITKGAFHYINKEIRNKSSSDLNEMSDEAWKDPSFQRALQLRMKMLQKAKKPVRAGVFVPDGVPIPAGVFNPGATGEKIEGGRLYSHADALNKTGLKDFIENTDGVEKRKRQIGGGEQFKKNLERSVGGSPKKIGILSKIKI